MRVLKKILLWLLLVAVLAALIVGGAVAWFYYNTDPEAFDAPAVTAGGTALARMTISAPRVARAALRALGCNRLLCCPGVLAKFIVFGSRFVPRTWAAAAAAALQKPGK